MYVLIQLWGDFCSLLTFAYRIFVYYSLFVFFGSGRAEKFAEAMCEKNRQEEAAYQAELETLIPKIRETFSEIRKILG